MSFPPIGEPAADGAHAGPADATLPIAPALVELAPDHIISTVGCNGSVPAPVIRLREGRAVSVELINNTDTPKLVHWHGQLGVMKDTVVVPGFGTMNVDFIANNPGATLFHCHQTLHMDYGLMRLFKYA